MLTDSMSKLKVVQQKFSDSMENIEKLKKIENGEWFDEIHLWKTSCFFSVIGHIFHKQDPERLVLMTLMFDMSDGYKKRLHYELFT